MSANYSSNAKVHGLVETSIRLGWRMAQVYHRPPPTQPFEEKPGEPLPDHLPGESKMGDYERGKTLIAEIQHDVQILEKAIGFKLTSQEDLANLINPGIDPNSTRKVLLTIQLELHRELRAQDPNLATGLFLGRMLADTVLLSNPKTPQTLVDEFGSYRLANAYRWLDDLHSLLPDYASDSVRGSLSAWELWAKGNGGVVPEKEHENFSRLLHHQGETWRRMLCGEKPAVDFLSAKNYKQAGDRLAKHFLGLIGSFVVSWWYVIFLFVCAIAGISVVILRNSPHSTTASFIAMAAGSLGISWKTLKSTLGRVVENAEKPLWEAEVKEAIVIATTSLPNDMKRS